jgi:hypothetical protein
VFPAAADVSGSDEQAAAAARPMLFDTIDAGRRMSDRQP